MENPRKAAKCMDFLSTGEMMDFHRKGGEMGRESLSTGYPHTENRKCGEKGWGDPAKSYRETLRRGDPCGRPREGQSPSPTHHKIRFRRGRRLPTVVPTDSRSLSCPPIGALPRNRIASSATGSASPISPTARPDFSSPHGRTHGPCPTRRCVIGPGRTGPSAPIHPLSPGWY